MILRILFLIIGGTIIGSGLISKYLGSKKKKGYRYCDLYRDQQLLDTGYCSAFPDCNECPHLKRLV